MFSILSILAGACSTSAFIMCLQNDDARQASIYSAAASCEIRNVEERSELGAGGESDLAVWLEPGGLPEPPGWFLERTQLTQSWPKSA